MSKKDRPTLTSSRPSSEPRSISVVPLITQEEWKMLWVVLDTAIDNGAFSGDAEVQSEYEELRRKVALRGDIR